jgi:hypothetical protein
MSRTQITYVEVILLTWQQFPEELLSLCAEWIVMECRFYRIAQADIAGALTIELLEFFEQLKAENRITDFCSRVVLTRQTGESGLLDTGRARESELPDWVRP